LTILEKGFLALKSLKNCRLMDDMISKPSGIPFVHWYIIGDNRALAFHHTEDILWLRATKIMGSTKYGKE
jgi:hypothetical protein